MTDQAEGSILNYDFFCHQGTKTQRNTIFATKAQRHKETQRFFKKNFVKLRVFVSLWQKKLCETSCLCVFVARILRFTILEGVKLQKKLTIDLVNSSKKFKVKSTKCAKQAVLLFLLFTFYFLLFTFYLLLVFCLINSATYTITLCSGN